MNVHTHHDSFTLDFADKFIFITLNGKTYVIKLVSLGGFSSVIFFPKYNTPINPIPNETYSNCLWRRLSDLWAKTFLIFRTIQKWFIWFHKGKALLSRDDSCNNYFEGKLQANKCINTFNIYGQKLSKYLFY